MSEKALSTLKASLAMIGAIVGAGIFGLPAAFVHVGFWPATILFFVLAVAVTITHLFFAEQLLSIREKHRLTWLAKHSLGTWGEWLAQLTYPLQIIAANYAYLLLGGEFLDVIARSAGIAIPVGIWQILFWFVCATTVYFGLKMMARVNAYATAALIVALIWSVIVLLPHVDIRAVARADWSDWYLPFGVFLFTLSGLSSIGEVVEIANRKRKQAYIAVASGTLVSAAVSWVFGCIIYLSAGGYPVRTVSEIASVFPEQYALLIPIVGLLAVATSYFTSAEDLKVSFTHDYKLGKVLAPALALGTPLVMLAIFPRDFLATISFVGAVFIGINSMIVSMIAVNGFGRHKTRWIRVGGALVSSGIFFIFLFGVLQRLLSRELL
ncbi:hypothetical protein IT407_03605 [Candidatus Uhrbacteria bacterium]|nr:hypothetical protein [Candidatus Uhrbacteria bacterium]